jgi:hypothetical protein
MSDDPDWTELPPELLHTISTNLTILKDYVRFRSVCVTWRISTPKKPSHLPIQLPWLMLPKSRTQQTQKRGFYSLTEDKVNFLDLPEVTNRRRRCGSSHGWLVIVDETPAIFLLNPLTRSRVHLPPLSNFPNVVSFDFYNIGREYSLKTHDGDFYSCSLKEMRDSFIKKLVLSGSPGNESDFVALAILNQTGDLAYCKKGENQWRFIEAAQSYCEDAIFHKGKFYAVNKYGGVAVCDVSGVSPIVSYINTPRQSGGDMQYLVTDEDDDILLVTRYLELEFDVDHYQLDIIYNTTEFQVYKLNLSSNGWSWVDVTSLEDKVLFVGENSSLALRASDFPGCKGNRIYYTDDYSEWNYDGVNGDHDLGVYNIEDGSIEALPCYPRNSYTGRRWPPPIWVTPNPC